MQFLLDHQAHFAANMAVWEDRLARLSVKTDRVTEAVLGLTGVVGSIATEAVGLVAAQKDTARQQERTDRQLEKTDRQLKETARQQEETARQQEETNRQLREADKRLQDADAGLRDSIKIVEAHLNSVIGMFERHLRDDHGTRPS
jgi:septal ring factor EnvC (AmiA/AmiB activator)